ncbi:MAG TPA: ABC transporter permease [Solirubrobacteraceae bacterium]|nr:ABC transporter permease [Solirubrobacteraceae bacterium]
MTEQAIGGPETTPTVSVVDDRLAEVSTFTKLLRRPELGALIGALAVGIFFAATAPSFRTLGGMANWTDVASTLGIMAVVVALLMIGGEFDLSAGVMTGTTGLFMGILTTEAGFSMWPAIVLTLLFAATVGFVNGIMVVKTKLPSFIVTLATFFVLQGVNLGVTKAITDTVRVAGLLDVPGYHGAATLLASTFWEPYNFRISVVWWIGITVVATWVLARTHWGNWIFAVGGDANAARNVGVPVARVKIALFMTVSVCAGLVGMMIALRLGSIQAGQGIGEEFTYIIAAVVGGCLLTGGYGSAIGASIGALIVGMAFIGIQFSGWNTDWRFLFLGVILLAAVLVNNLVRKSAEGARR